MEDSKVKRPLKLSAFTAIAVFIGAYAWMILIHVIVEVIEIGRLGSKTLGKAASNKMFSSNTVLIVASYAVLEIVILLVACFMVRRFKQSKLKLEDLGMKFSRNSLKQITLGFVIVPVMYVFIYLTMFAFGIVSFKNFGLSSQPLIDVIGTVITIFVVTALAGFCEEIVFRGVILKYLMNKINVPAALIISSALFSIMHIGRYDDLITLLSIIIIGMVLGYIFVKTKSIYLSIGVHYVWDLIGSLMGVGKSMFNTNFILTFQDAKNSDTLAELIVIAAFLLLLVAVFIRYKKVSVDAKY